MEKVKEFMDIYSQEIIRKLGKKEFNTTDIVSTIIQRKEWQKEYIKLSEQYGSYNKLNAQIGRYLLINQKKLEICKNGGKEESIAITKRLSSNQKWRLLFVPLLLFVSISTYAQTLIPKENSKSKWGYVNEIGKTVIKYKYDDAREFSEELAAISREGKWGYIGKTGKEIIPSKYDEVSDFSEGLARVKSNGKLGFIDKNGKEVIPVKYEEIGDFSEEGLAKVKSGNYWGFIDKTGKERIPVKYREIGDFLEGGLAKVKSGNYWGFLDKTGREIIPVIYDGIDEFSENLARVKREGKIGFIDKTGKEIIPVKYDEIGTFSEEGLTKVKNGGYWGFLDKTGEVVLPIEYNEIGVFYDGIVKVKKNNKFGFVDKTGKVVTPLKYDEAIDFSNGYAAYAYSKPFFTYGGFVSTETNWGIIDKAGQEILLAEYTEKEVKEMLSDPVLLKKKIERETKKEMLIEDILNILDNDYYSDESHSIEVLAELIDKLKEQIDNSSDKEKKRLEELYKNLWYAVRTKMMTETYGSVTAKKIMTGKYEIGMSKDACFDAIADYVPLSLDMFFGGKRFVIDVKLSSETKTTEIWEVVGPGKKKMIWTFNNGKLISITNY